MEDSSNLSSASEQNEVVDETGPVAMPDLPLRLVVTTPQQFKAIGDPLRSRILGIIRHRPATAKQIADTLGVAPGTIGHHLQVLEAAGLAQVVARRVVHGIIARYYTRTARIFQFELPPEVQEDTAISLKILTDGRDELAESLALTGKDIPCRTGFPHARLSSERVKVYEERITQLIEDFLQEPAEPDGQVYGLSLGLFLSPPYLQEPRDS